MAVWPFMMALAGLAFVLALWLRVHVITAGAILGAYIVGRVIKEGMADDNQVIAFAVMWMCVAGIDAISRQPDTKTIILSGVALCYLAAWLLKSPWVIGSWPFVMSDVLAVAAILWFTGEVALVGRGRSEGDSGVVRDLGASVHLGHTAASGLADLSRRDDGQA